MNGIPNVVPLSMIVECFFCLEYKDLPFAKLLGRFFRIAGRSMAPDSIFSLLPRVLYFQTTWDVDC